MTNFKQQIKTLIAPSLGAKLVTSEELTTMLSYIKIQKGMAMFANVVQLTEPKVTKKDRLTGEPFINTIHKLTEVNVILNSEYNALVRNQNLREGNDESAHKKGANTMPLDKSKSKNNFFGYFKDKGAIEYKPNYNEGFVVKTQWFLDAKEVDKKQLPDVLPKTYKAKNQGTEVEILWRKLYVENIVQITINKDVYRVI